MNGLQIRKILEKFPSFVGVYASDMLPEVTKYPASYVMNTKPSSHPGEHWVAAYFVSPHFCEYFDSAGLPPIEEDIKAWITSNAQLSRYSSAMVQDTDPSSDACGNFTIAFIALRDQGFKMEEIVSYFFSPDKPCNDKIAKAMSQIIGLTQFVPIERIKEYEGMEMWNAAINSHQQKSSSSKSLLSQLFSRKKKS